MRCMGGKRGAEGGGGGAGEKTRDYTAHKEDKYGYQKNALHKQLCQVSAGLYYLGLPTE